MEAHSVSGSGEAIVHFNQAIALDPEFALAYAMLGRSYQQRAMFSNFREIQDETRAETFILKALELDDSESAIHASVGYLKTWQGDFSGAELAYKRAIALNPNDTEANAGYACVLRRRFGQSDEAVRLWRKAYELDPNTERGQLRLFFRLKAAGKLEEALKQIESLAAKYPQSSQVYRRLGNFYMRHVVVTTMRLWPFARSMHWSLRMVIFRE